jgi:hypothetical protein
MGDTQSRSFAGKCVPKQELGNEFNTELGNEFNTELGNEFNLIL